MTSGNLDGCEVTGCDWLNQVSQIIQDPMACDLPVCRMIKNAISGNTIMGFISEWVNTLFESVKMYIIIGAIVFISVIFIMFLMMLYLVFK
jgi:hypothetical protein